MKCIRQPNHDYRTDIWVPADAAAYVLHKLKRIWKWGWRAVHWRSWVDQFSDNREKRVLPPVPKQIVIATYNINGWQGKAEKLVHFLQQEGIAIALLQETLIYRSDMQVSIGGYDCFPIDAERGVPGRRGQALCVHKNLKATSLNLNDSNIVGVRTAKIPSSKGNWYIFGLYLPSGNNYCLERGQILGRLQRLLRKLVHKDPKAQIMVGGDWNIEREKLQHIVSKWKLPIRLHRIGGSSKTRRSKAANASWSSIDGFLVSENAVPMLNVSRVNRKWDLSDHYPVMCSVKGNVAVPLAKGKTLFDCKKIANLVPMIASDNRWKILEAMGEQMDVDLDEFEAKFMQTCQDIASDNKLIVNVSGEREAHGKPKE